VTPPAPEAGSHEQRADLRRRRMRGSHPYVCRGCRNAVRVVGTRSLPDECPFCGASTWGPDGACAGPGCDAHRPPGVRGRAFCHACGHSIWLHVGTSPAETAPGGEDPPSPAAS
jgi:hypothetical protein